MKNTPVTHIQSAIELSSDTISTSLVDKNRDLLSRAAALVSDKPAYFIESPLIGGYHCATDIPVLKPKMVELATSEPKSLWACGVLDRAATAMAQLSTIKSGHVPDNFENGQGFIQHTPESVRKFLDGAVQMLIHANQPEQAELLAEEGLNYKATSQLIGDPLISSVLKRISCIDPLTLREWGHSYIAREISDATPHRSGMKHRVLKEIPVSDLLPVDSAVEATSLTKSTVYIVGKLGFLTREHAIGHARDLVVSAELTSLLKDPQFPVIYGTHTSALKYNLPLYYIKHPQESLSTFKELLALGVFLAMQDTQYKDVLKSDSVESFEKKMSYLHAILNDYGNPLAQHILRLSTIDETGREWNFLRPKQQITDDLASTATEIEGSIRTYEQALLMT